GNEIVSLRGSQSIEIVTSSRCLTSVQLNRIENSDVQTFMHQPVAGTNAPQRWRAQLVGRGLTSVLHNAISSANIVKSEITEGVNYLVAQSCRDGESPAVD